MLFKIYLYRTTKILLCDDFLKELTNKFFKKFKEILGRQYENEFLVGEISISYFFIDISYLCYVFHDFFFLMFCILDIIGKVVNVEP